MAALTLKWGDEFGMRQTLHSMMASEELVDTTLMCEGQFLQTHKCVLAACSEQFRQIFKAASDKIPIVVLKGVRMIHLKNILHFIYLGEVSMSQDDLAEFLSTAVELGISALASNSKDSATAHKVEVDPLEIITESKIHLASCSPSQSSPSTPAANLPASDDAKKNERNSQMDCPKVKIEEIDIEVMKEDDWSDSSQHSEHNLDYLDVDDQDTVDFLGQICFVPDAQSGVPDAQSEVPDAQSEVPDAQSEVPDDSVPSTSQGEQRPVSPKTSSTRRVKKRPIINSDEKHILKPDTPAAQGTGGNSKKSKKTSTSSKKSRKMLADNATEGTFYCDYCPLTFDSKRQKLDHFKVHKHGPVTCFICQKVFKNRSSLHDHRCRCHNGPQVGVQLVCATCGYTSSRKFRVREHERSVHGLK